MNIAQSVLIVTDAGATASGLPQGTYFISHPGVGFVSRLTINGYNGFPMVQKIDEKFLPVVSSVVMKSSTADSTKQFKITVDDSGTLTVTEIV